MSNNQCDICYLELCNFSKDINCDCKINICEICLNKWNDINKPRQLCPVCRKEYGVMLTITPYFDNRIIVFSNSNNNQLYGQYCMTFLLLVGMIIIILIVIGFILLIK